MKKLIIALMMACGLAACGIGDTNTTYERREIGAQARVEYGQIVEMTQIQTAGTSGIGTLAGAGAGAAAGSMLGGNTAVNIIGGIGGALVGGAIGSSAEGALTRDTAFEFLIRKSNGQMITVVQTNELNLRAGDEVYLSVLNGVSRIRSKK